ncbi:hypothetical protein ACQEU5_08010 [Marinactinospora thermotolerans]|uniref:hypothetical protein n=1 Tax=Marinactinospora thermotolerans TaxID=531310 RepID=UPI003D9056F4
MTVDEARKVLEGEVAAVAASSGVFSDSRDREVAERLAAESGSARPEWHEFRRPRQLTVTGYKRQFTEPFQRDRPADNVLSRPSARPRPVAAARGGSGCGVFLLMSTGIDLALTEVAPHLPIRLPSDGQVPEGTRIGRIGRTRGRRAK